MKIELQGTITVKTLIKYFEEVLDRGWGHENSIRDLLSLLSNLEKESK